MLPIDTARVAAPGQLDRGGVTPARGTRRPQRLGREETGAPLGGGEHVGERTARARRPDGAGVLDLFGVGGEEPGQAVAGDAVGEGLVEVAERVLRGTSAHGGAAQRTIPGTNRRGRSSVGPWRASRASSSTPSATNRARRWESSYVSPEGLDGDRRKTLAGPPRRRRATSSTSTRARTSSSTSERRGAARPGRAATADRRPWSSRCPPSPGTAPACMREVPVPGDVSVGDEVLVGARRSDARLVGTDIGRLVTGW